MNFTERKISTAKTPANCAFTYQAQKKEKFKHVTNALTANVYPATFIFDVKKKQNLKNKVTPSTEDLVIMFSAPADLSNVNNNDNKAVLPYIRGLTEPLITRIFKRHDIRVTKKARRTLKQDRISIAKIQTFY